jgi:hypothetical protein
MVHKGNTKSTHDRRAKSKNWKEKSLIDIIKNEGKFTLLRIN